MRDSARQPLSDRSGHLYWPWVRACTAGELIGIGTAAVAALAVSAVYGEPASLGARAVTLAVFAVVGVVEGGALAALQWRVLRGPIPRLRAGEWVGITVAVAVAGWLLGMAPSLFLASGAPSSAAAVEPGLGVVLLMAATVGAGAGLCFGAAQWVVLTRHAERAGRWIWIHVPAWALAMAAIFLGASLPDSASPAWFIGVTGVAGGVLGGLLLGAVTGVVVRSLRPWVDERRWSLRGKVCVVTGANSGIGYEVALGLARLGGTVIVLCRREEEGERVRRSILERHGEADVTAIPCDLSDFASIRTAAGLLLRGWSRLDVLVHNAGATFATRTITNDAVEATLAVDVVGPFLLTALLRARLEMCGSRVITLTGRYYRRGRMDVSDLHFARRPYHWLEANNQAQLGRRLFTSALAARAPRLLTMSVHPGAVLTAAQARLPRVARLLVRTILRPGFVRPEVGAIPVLRLAAAPDLDSVSGRFFDRCRATADQPDPRLVEAFWMACEEMTQMRASASHDHDDLRSSA